ncbi:hypothetical protein D3C73_1546920 [compost metagenome]
MPIEASAGTDSGRISRLKIVKWLAPSIKADSNKSFGSWLMKLYIKYVTSGRPNAVCASQMPK